MSFNSTLQTMNSTQESSNEIIDRVSKLTNPIPTTPTSTLTKSFLIQSNTQENRPIRTRMISVNQEEPIPKRVKTMIKPIFHSKPDHHLQEKLCFENSNFDISHHSSDCILLERNDSLSKEINPIQHNYQPAQQIINHISHDPILTNNIINKPDKLICSVSNCKASFHQKCFIQRHEKLHLDFNQSSKLNCQCGKGFTKPDELIKHSLLGICYGSRIPFR
ncbi:uncharacterized protein MELLADRAFT_103386 [Melampsora larici-populina 98AG31]|uniref:C2H2-type domain-containing protein n=1 Tax=Melampsora larici-populina (strain 98AG31 / pathotype 3-4-7) TaxID=747676 RepID=F4RBA9_MELLP|nr:uncharacterized protein MELLADRAFT_103386 [Melampsora larici-populina 98AG31]EGG10052.1 hypothetical protein MELLADRAFT_103386 [Melampsora larici-populina 98AG31]